jgi:hypothetical protein
MRPASRATRCCRSSCALHMRASLVDAGRLVAHPRTIKEIMHASPVDRIPIEHNTTTDLTAQRKSPAEGLPGRGLLRFRGDVKFRLLQSEEGLFEACRSSSSVPQAPTSRVRSRPNRSSDASSRRFRSPRVWALKASFANGRTCCDRRLNAAEEDSRKAESAFMASALLDMVFEAKADSRRNATIAAKL